MIKINHFRTLVINLSHKTNWKLPIQVKLLNLRKAVGICMMFPFLSRPSSVAWSPITCNLADNGEISSSIKSIIIIIRPWSRFCPDFFVQNAFPLEISAFTVGWLLNLEQGWLGENQYSHLENAYRSLKCVRLCVRHRNMAGNNKSFLAFLGFLPLLLTQIGKRKVRKKNCKEWQHSVKLLMFL